jgi:hypothetical protein
MERVRKTPDDFSYDIRYSDGDSNPEIQKEFKFVTSDEIWRHRGQVASLGE